MVCSHSRSHCRSSDRRRRQQQKTLNMSVLLLVVVAAMIENRHAVAFSPRQPKLNGLSLSASRVSVLEKEETKTLVEMEDVLIGGKDDDDDDGSDSCRVYTVQILMSDTGGGHRASANAIRDALDALHPGKFVCDIVDLYTEYGPFWPYNDYPRMYKIMAKYSWMWDLFYKFGETEFGLKLNEFMLSTFCAPNFRECLQRAEDPATLSSPKRRPDMVVSVHPLCQDVPLKVLEELDGGKRTTPFVTVTTDLGGAHKTWFNPNVDKCFVPSDVLNEKARSRGLKPSQIVQHGLPVRRGFWSDDDTDVATTQDQQQNRFPYFATEKTDSKKTASVASAVEKSLHEKLGLQPELPTCLVVGGGDGMGGLVDIASALGQELGSRSSQPTSQMVVICGNNRQAQESLDKVNFGDGVNVCVKGFVSNMDEYMNAADCLVTKAGPGTIAEASICGLPCMLFAYLPGQEEGNVPFVEENGFGQYSSDPNVIAHTVTSWLESPEKMESMRTAALESSRPHSTLDIAKDLAEIVFETSA
mmetsp:Transcript_57475/g.140278  ORF Transcript_57475/g.140278 Transcript_57475/m.140278 type:complete len:529 (+) Transcript_57475:175-1761(+)